MKIRLEDISKWKDDSQRVARELSLDKEIIDCLERETELVIVPGHYRNLGVVNFTPPKLFAHEQTEGTKCLDGSRRDIFHQSEIDRLLFGELYNFYAELPDDFSGARKTQIQFAEYRANENNVFSREWKIKAKKLSESLIPKPVRYKVA